MLRALRSATQIAVVSLEMNCGPSQPPAADINTLSRRRRSGRRRIGRRWRPFHEGL